MKGILIYYVVSPVHLRNVELIAAALPDWEFRVTFEEPNLYITQMGEREKRFAEVPLRGPVVPSELWAGEVRAVLFSTVQPRVAVMNLLQATRERGLPAIALEESNQIALNSGAVNNYLLPVDALFVASEAERDGMLRDGLQHRNIEVSGWPFFHGRSGGVSAEERAAAKQKIGLDPARPVAALTLTALHAAGESPAIRERQLTLAAAGLPPEFQLAIKPHPVEKLETLRPFVERCAPLAVVVDGMVPIAQFLAASDVLLNRGVSHVVFEALWLSVPIVVLETGVPTPFDDPAPEIIARTPEEVGRLCASLCADPQPLQRYDAFCRRHLPFAPEEARRRTAECIAAFIAAPTPRRDEAADWLTLALAQAWQGNRRGAEELLRKPALAASTQRVAAIARLFRRRATASDREQLAAHFGTSFDAFVARALYIDQLASHRLPPAPDDLAWLEDFPPHTHTPLFLDRVLRWFSCLEKHDLHAEAARLRQKMASRYADAAGVPKLLERMDQPPRHTWRERMILGLRSWAGVPA